MSTSLRDLLRAARDRERSGTDDAAYAAPSASVDEADAAITALAHVARAIQLVSRDEAGQAILDTPRRRDAATQLAEQAAAAAATWPATAARLPDLVAAAADWAGRRRPPPSSAARWAIVVAFAETARACAAIARRFGPYEHLEVLAAVHRAAAQVEQVAAAEPPTAAGSAVLDYLVPPAELPAAGLGVDGGELIRLVTDATAGLVAAVAARVATGELRVADALAATLVARMAALRGVELVAALSRSPIGADAPWRAAPAAWRAVQLSYAPFDDGSKHTLPSSSSPVLAWSALLHAALPTLIHPGPAVRTPRRDEDEVAEAATALRTVANQLPELAQLLEAAADRWATRGQLFAPERRLTSYEDRNLAVTSTDRVLIVEHSDLLEVITATRDAQPLSAALAAALDTTRVPVGRQPSPHLAAAHAVGVTGPGAARDLARRAAAVQRRGAATAPAPWAATAAATRSRGPRR